MYIILHMHIFGYIGGAQEICIWFNVSRGTSDCPHCPCVCLDRLWNSTCVFKTASLTPNSRGQVAFLESMANWYSIWHASGSCFCRF